MPQKFELLTNLKAALIQRLPAIYGGDVKLVQSKYGKFSAICIHEGEVLLEEEIGFRYVDYNDEAHPLIFPDAASVLHYFAGLVDGFDDKNGGSPKVDNYWYRIGYHKTVNEQSLKSK